METSEIISTLREITDTVKENYRADIISIFGSRARGEHSEKSDLDIIVHFHEGASLFDLVGLGYLLEEKLGMKVDIVSDRAIKPEMLNSINREAIKI